MNIKQLVIVLMITFCSGTLLAQQTNTLYFMKGVTERSEYNPAFQSDYNFWFDFPLLPNLNINLGNNSLTYNDIFFNKDGKYMSFLDMNAGEYRNKFMETLKPTTHIKTNIGIN